MNSKISTEYILPEQKVNETKKITERLNKLSEVENVGLERVFLHINSSSNNSGAEDFISGCMSILNKNTNVSESFIHSNMFGQVMLFHVKKVDPNTGKEVNVHLSELESNTQDILEKLNYALPQNLTSKTATHPSMDCMVESRKLKDAKEWQSILGAGGRIGLYQNEIDHDEYEYYLLVHVNETPASLELYKWVYEQEPGSLSLKDFINSPEYKYVQNINRRNARRLGAKAALALGFHVDLEEDSTAYVSNEHKVLPKLAVPYTHNEYNTFEMGLWDKKKSFMLYDNTYCTQKATGGLLLLEDARSPVHLFPSTKQKYDSTKNSGVTTNYAGFSFPYNLGQTIDTSSFLTSQDLSSVFSKKDEEQINRRVIWENKKSNHFNHNVVSSIFRHYNVQDKEQHRIFSKLYEGDLNAVITLKPIAVKISNEEYHGYDLN